MAGERKGKAYEALVKVALDQLVAAGALVGTVFWNETPAAMTIEPDFCVGATIDAPTLVIPVTHSGSAKDSEKKFWRNIGELAEAKVRLPAVPRVVNVAFDSVIKKDLKTLQDYAFDAQLLVGDKPYGAAIRAWVDAHNSKLPRDQNQKVAIVASATTAYSAFAIAFAQFVQDLKTAVMKQNTAMDRLWNLERARSTGRAPKAKDTFLRRGGAKLLVFDKPTDVLPNGTLASGIDPATVKALVQVGLVQNSIVPVVADPEILWAAQNLSQAQQQQLTTVKGIARVKEWVNTLMGLAALPQQLAYIAKKWNALLTGQGLYNELKSVAAAPRSIAPTVLPPGFGQVWLYHLLIEWIKLGGGSRTAYGSAQLIKDLRQYRGDSSHQAAVKTILGRDPEWRSAETIRLGIQDWQSAFSTQQFALRDDDLARVADVLSRRLLATVVPVVSKDLGRVQEAIVQTTLEAKLLTYRGFKPFRLLLEQALQNQGYQWEYAVATEACFAQMARASKVPLDPRSGGTTVMLVGGTIINWQAAHGSHTNDKKKELAGRAVALRYAFDASKGVFVHRPGVKKLILLLDGTWKQSDLEALVRAGWDEIYYPDQVPQLVASIV